MSIAVSINHTSHHARRGVYGLHRTESVADIDAVASIVALVCLVGAAVASGLTITLTSQDRSEVAAIAARSSASALDRRNARRVAALLDQHHFLLVSLLLWNALFVESLPLVLEAMSSSAAVICVVSTLLVTVCGEIVPQATFLRHALSVAGALAPVVWLMMVVSAPISWPIAKLLDAVVGHKQQAAMRRDEIRELIASQTVARLFRGGDDETDEAASSPSRGAEHELRLLSPAAAAEGGSAAVQVLSPRRTAEDTADLPAPVASPVANGGDADGSNGGASGGGLAERLLAVVHGTPAGSAAASDELSPAETALLRNAMHLSELTVDAALLAVSAELDELTMLDIDQTLARSVVDAIADIDTAHILVFERHRRNVLGFVSTHELLSRLLFADDSDDAAAPPPRISDFALHPVERCVTSDLFVVLFRKFTTAGASGRRPEIVLVHDDATGAPVGIVTRADFLCRLFADGDGANSPSASAGA